MIPNKDMVGSDSLVLFSGKSKPLRYLNIELGQHVRMRGMIGQPES